MDIPRTEQQISANRCIELLPPLSEAELLLDYRAKMDNKKEIVDGASYILGIDAGSTTTKAVLMNVAESSVDASHYLR